MMVMFKNIFNRLKGLIIKPGEAWEELSRQDEKSDTFLMRFIYPLIGIVALAAFLGIFFTYKEFDFEIALRIMIRTVIAVAGGFYLGAYLLNEVWKGIFHQPKDIELCRFFVGYASSLIFVLYILTSLLPDFFFLQIFVLYTFYIIWEGATVYMQVTENEQLKFTIITSCIVVLSPMVIEYVLRMMMPGFRV